MSKNKKLARGTILLANGNLSDPNFTRTAVLLCEHSETGAYGLVLNQPTQIALQQVFPDTPAFASCTQPLYTGGPCELDRIQVLHSIGAPEIGGVLVCRGVYVGGDFLKILSLCGAGSAAKRHCRFFQGYSGWGEGQLESEMEANTWIVCPARQQTVFSEDAAGMWTQVLKSMGGYYSFLATMPLDLSAN